MWSVPSDRAGYVESDPTTRCPAQISIPGLLLPEADALPNELPGGPNMFPTPYETRTPSRMNMRVTFDSSF